jgi:hypothetical protein
MHEALSKGFDLLKASGWQTSMLVVASGLFLLLIGIGIVPDVDPWVKVVAWALLLISGALAMASLGPTIQGAIRSATEPRRKQRLAQAAEQRFKDYVPHLSIQEREILGYLRAKNKKMLLAADDGGHAATLLARGVIEYAGVRGQTVDLDNVPMAVPDHVWNVLVEWPDEFPYVPKFRPQDRDVEVEPWRVPWW